MIPEVSLPLSKDPTVQPSYKNYGQLDLTRVYRDTQFPAVTKRCYTQALQGMQTHFMQSE
jgi:hypothetical protein